MIKTLITAHQLSGDMAISLTPLQEAMHHSVDRVDGHLRSRSSGTQLLAPIDHCRHLLDSLRQERKSKELKDQAKKILAFLGTRTEKRYLKKTVNQGAGRELNCNKAGPELRTGLDETRAKEWSNWQKVLEHEEDHQGGVRGDKEGRSRTSSRDPHALG